MASRKKPRKTRRRRRRRYGGFGGPLDAIIKPDLLKQTLIAGAIAAGGAWVTHIVAGKVSKSLKLKGQMQNLVIIAIGGIAAALVYRFTRKKDIALAVGMGPAMVVTLQLLGKGAMLATTPGNQGLGAITAEPSASFEPLTRPPTQNIPSVSNLIAETTVI